MSQDMGNTSPPSLLVNDDWNKVRSDGRIGSKMIPMNEPVETAELLAFARAIEAKSLSRAAAELGVPRATVGRRLARLEERLGTRLLRRTTRSLTLTDAGEMFYRHARIVLDAVEQAQESVRTKDNVMRGHLRVSVPPVNEESFSVMITAFAKKYPDVRVQVDFSTRLVDLLREGYDVALRASAEIQPGLVARVVARHELIAVASPAYLSKYGVPRAVKELRRHRCITSFARGELPQTTWPVGSGVVHVDGAFSSNNLSLLRDAAIRGLGIALLPSIVIGDLVNRGVLLHVLPGVLRAESRLAVVYPERAFLPAHVRAFVEALIEWAPTIQGVTKPRATGVSRKRR
jgi:DNA-binding transcriptional LysR family regulator